jgi:putative ABC transport system permease protein
MALALPALPLGLRLERTLGWSGAAGAAAAAAERGRFLASSDATPAECLSLGSPPVFYYLGGHAGSETDCLSVSEGAAHVKGGTGPEAITWTGVLLSVVFLGTAFLGTGRYLKHNLEVQAAVSTVRCTVQLIVLGYGLGPIFSSNNPFVVLLYTTFTAVMAALEAASRPAVAYDGMTKHSVFVILCAAYTAAFWACFIVLRVGINALYAIPVMGMILGNTSTAVAVTLTSVTNTLKDKRDVIEVKLAMGATRWEAMTSTIKDAVVLGMTPVLNSMNIMGLVSIPGMMTGQILGGTPPALAARYQLIIMFLLAGAAVSSATGVGIMVLVSCSDSAHRLHHARLKKRSKKGKSDPLQDLAHFVITQSQTAFSTATSAMRSMQSGAGAGRSDAAESRTPEEERGLLLVTPPSVRPPRPAASAAPASPSPFPSLSASSPGAAPPTPDVWSSWQRTVDPASGNSYFYNRETSAVSWTPPEGWPSGSR